MYMLRATKKLLHRMRVPPAEAAAPGTTLLGDWYCNLLHTRRGQLILAVSERTLLPVLLPAKDARSLPVRLPDALADVLRLVGVAAHVAERELSEMTSAAVTGTNSRQVLGTMNDFAWMLEVGVDRTRSLVEAAIDPARTPCGPIAMESPDRATRAAFERASATT